MADNRGVVYMGPGTVEVHDIDYPALLLGAPASVKATLGEGILGIEAEESADMLWGDGPCVHLRLDYVTPVKTRSIRITTDCNWLNFM